MDPRSMKYVDPPIGDVLREYAELYEQRWALPPLSVVDFVEALLEDFRVEQRVQARK